MSAGRFFHPFSGNDTRILLDDPDEFAHLTRVLRSKAGDSIELVNGQGGLAQGVLQEVSRIAAWIDIISVMVVPRDHDPRITLACAIPKRAKFETIIEKCTELGVDRIIPMVTARTENDAHGEKADHKLARYQRVALNAAKQCKRLWFPEITLPVSFPQTLAMTAVPGKFLFFPWLEGERLSLDMALAVRREAGDLVFFIGPEGDFTPEEAAEAVGAGAVPVTLGKNVLKVDTAAIAVVSFAILNKSPG